MKKPILLFLFFLLSLAFLPAYEQSRGNIKIVLNEGPGTFSLYDITDPENPIPLLLDKDAKTSALFVLVDDKVYRMERSSAFKQSLEVRENGAAYIWSNRSLSITLEFLFTKSVDSPVEDGVNLRVFVNNSSGRSQKVGVRFLLDTYLGEKAPQHFYLPGGEGVTEEKNIHLIPSLLLGQWKPLHRHGLPGYGRSLEHRPAFTDRVRQLETVGVLLLDLPRKEEEF